MVCEVKVQKEVLESAVALDIVSSISSSSDFDFGFGFGFEFGF